MIPESGHVPWVSGKRGWIAYYTPLSTGGMELPWDTPLFTSSCALSLCRKRVLSYTSAVTVKRVLSSYLGRVGVTET